jgi:uncharacterized repeat protein (TIGR03803 family)
MGGSAGGGTIYKLNLDGSGFTVICNFAKTGAYSPFAELLEGDDGALYGLTEFGNPPNQFFGTVFKINKDGSGLTNLYGKLYIDVMTDCRLVEGDDGGIYGTSMAGGGFGLGEVFRLNKDGSDFTVLHGFTGADGEGGFSAYGLTKGKNGEFYGAATFGDYVPPGGGILNGYGAVFAVRPAPLATGVTIQTNGAASVMLAGRGGSTYTIQATDALSPPAWTSVGTATASSGGQIQFTDADAPAHKSRFYRTLLQ